MKTEHLPDLADLREEIRGIDDELLALVRKRLDVARRVADAKRDAGLPVLDPAREAAVVRYAGEFAREHGLVEEDVRALFWALVGLTRRAELTLR
jgi:chorismate mutase